MATKHGPVKEGNQESTEECICDTVHRSYDRIDELLHYRDFGLVPWLGLSMMVASCITITASLGILVAVDRRAAWSGPVAKVIKPASCLSALLSANSIFLHVAMTEGLTVAWWFRACAKYTTIADLHDTWSHGTSLLSALRAGRKVNLVTLASVFVGLIPLNGFLLQGAISTELSTESKPVEIVVPMVKQLPSGYSATINPIDGQLDSSGGQWGYVWQQFVNVAMVKNPEYYYFGTNNKTTSSNPAFYTKGYDFGCDESAVCTSTVPGSGFVYECSQSQIPYDLLPRKDNETTTGEIFQSSFTWNASDPNELALDIYWKSDQSCTGSYEARRCTLRAATVEYPIQLRMNISTAYSGPFYSLQESSTLKDDKLVSLISPYENEGQKTSTYGGIALSLGKWYNSTYEVSTTRQDDFGYQTTKENVGHLASLLIPGIPEFPDDGTFWGGCNMTFNVGVANLQFLQSLDDKSPNPETVACNTSSVLSLDYSDMILEQVRKAMFLASIDRAAMWWVGNNPADPNPSEYMQRVTAQQVRPVTIYVVRYYLWGATVAVTYSIILFVAPTFWGFWTIGRKPTMSPVDIARAFGAPGLKDYNDDLEVLLRQVGGRRIDEE